MRTAAVVAVLAAASAAHADRTLRHEALVEAPPAAVWEAFTTDEGITAWMVPVGEVDLRVGGAYRTSYDEETGLDGPNLIVNEILAYEPERMIAIRNVKAPEGLAGAELFRQTWSVIRFEPVGPAFTRVIITGHGYGEGPDWDALHGFFETGNRWTMDRLAEYLDDPGVETDAEKVMVQVRRLMGGCWRAEKVGEKSTLRSVFTLREASGGAQLVAEGWIGDAEAVHPHALAVFSVDPRSGLAWVEEFIEDGSRMSGPLWLEGETLVNGVTLRNVGRGPWDLRSEYTFTDDDHCRWTLRNADGEAVIELDEQRRPIEDLNDWVEGDMDTNARFARHPADKAIVVEATIDASPADVWRVWTTNEGFGEVFGRATDIELREGGAYEIYWDSDNRIGSNGCTVLGFRDGESLRFTWNAPPTIPEIRERLTVVTVTLEPAGDGRTRITLRNDGYEDGGAWDEAFAYFAAAWPKVVGTITEHFGGEVTLTSAE